MSTTLCGHRVCALTDGGYVICGLTPGHKGDHQPDYIDIRERIPRLPLLFACRKCATTNILSLIVPCECPCVDKQIRKESYEADSQRS